MTASKKCPSSKPPFRFLLLFSLPFAAVGVGMGAWLAYDVAAYLKMQGWVETPAKIVQAKLESSSDSDGGTTYRATAEYAYEYQGHRYTSHRVGITGGSDNVGSFQKNAYRQLNEHQKSGRPFRCFVNSSNPSEAILFRDLRWGMVLFRLGFVFAFGTAGFGLMTFAILGRRKAKQEKTLTAEHPDEPWLCKPDWAAGRIRSSSGMTAVVMVAFALFWNAIAIPAAIMAIHEVFFKHGDRFALIALAFPIVGLVLIVAAIVAIMRRRKYGCSVFELAAVPGVVGGQLAGVIHVPTKIRTDDGFQLSLNCIQTVTTNRGDSNSTSENVLWQDEQLIARELRQADPEKTAIPVLFQIPYECRSADAAEQIAWRLECKSKTPDLDYAATFDVPVFKTPESDPTFVAGPNPIADHFAPIDPEKDLCEAGLVREPSQTGEGCRLVFPMARHWGAALLFTIMAIVFSAVPFFVYFKSGGGWERVADLPFIIIFGLFGVILTFIALDLWFYRSVVDASPRGLVIVGGWFGLGRAQEIAAADVVQIVPVSRMSSGNGAGKNTYYNIDVVLTSGKHIKAGKHVPGMRLAKSVVREIEGAMGNDKLK